jgi:hypothetical protein
LEGAIRWKKERLRAPAVILNATDEYRQKKYFLCTKHGSFDLCALPLPEKNRLV